MRGCEISRRHQLNMGYHVNKDANLTLKWAISNKKRRNVKERGLIWVKAFGWIDSKIRT